MKSKHSLCKMMFAMLQKKAHSFHAEPVSTDVDGIRFRVRRDGWFVGDIKACCEEQAIVRALDLLTSAQHIAITERRGIVLKAA